EKRFRLLSTSPGKQDRSSDTEAEDVLFKRRRTSSEEWTSIHRVIPEKLVSRAVKLTRSGLRFNQRNAGSGQPVSGAVAASEHMHFSYGIQRRIEVDL